MTSLVGTTSSSVRFLPDIDGRPLSIVRSAGPYLFGDDGVRYVDTAMGYGGSILGHAPQSVVHACTAALENGPLPAFSHPAEERAAALVTRRLGPLQKFVFCNSGSEAVHLACRIARTVTGRKRVAKMAAGFDGWLDEVAFGTVDTREAAFHDQERPTNGSTTLLRFNDPVYVERLFDDNDDIAAVIYEPILANAACLMPSSGYLEHVQAVARRHGALLIADEVLMGFRIQNGLTSHAFGLDPDLATVGKAIASGVAAAGVVGRTEILAEFLRRKGARGGTFSGNPVACAAVEATMRHLEGADYPALLAYGDRLRHHLERSFADEGMALATSGFGTVFSVWFTDAAPADYDTARRVADPDLSLELHLRLREYGLIVMHAPYGRLYVSFAHDDEALAIMEAAITAAARAMGARRRPSAPIGARAGAACPRPPTRRLMPSRPPAACRTSRRTTSSSNSSPASWRKANASTRPSWPARSGSAATRSAKRSRGCTNAGS